MLKHIPGAALALCLVGLLAGQAIAQTAPATPAPPTRIRGTIASLAGQTLSVNSRDGQKLEVTLADNVTVVTVKKVDLASIAAGSYIGTARAKAIFRGILSPAA